MHTGRTAPEDICNLVQLPFPLVVCTERSIIFQNAIFADVFGYSDDEILDMSPFDLLPEWAAQPLKIRYDELMKGNAIAIPRDVPVYSKSGDIRLYDVYPFVIQGGRSAAILLCDPGLTTLARVMPSTSTKMRGPGFSTAGSNIWKQVPVLPADLPATGLDRGRIGAKAPSLTRSQMQVAELVAEGDRNKVIAYKLGISEGSVKSRIHVIMRKLGVNTRRELSDSLNALVEMA